MHLPCISLFPCYTWKDNPGFYLKLRSDVTKSAFVSSDSNTFDHLVSKNAMSKDILLHPLLFHFGGNNASRSYGCPLCAIRVNHSSQTNEVPEL